MKKQLKAAMICLFLLCGCFILSGRAEAKKEVLATYENEQYGISIEQPEGYVKGGAECVITIGVPFESVKFQYKDKEGDLQEDVFTENAPINETFYNEEVAGTMITKEGDTIIFGFDFTCFDTEEPYTIGIVTKKSVKFSVHDIGSGLKSYTLNGVEYDLDGVDDFETKVYWADFPEDLQELTIQAEDMVGNVSSKTFTKPQGNTMEDENEEQTEDISEETDDINSKPVILNHTNSIENEETPTNDEGQENNDEELIANDEEELSADVTQTKEDPKVNKKATWVFIPIVMGVIVTGGLVFIFVKNKKK